LSPHIQQSLGIVNCRCQFQTISDDSRISHESIDAPVIESGNRLGIEPMKGAAKMIAFSKNGKPTESSLGAFQHQKFEKASIIEHRHTPFMVVIGNIEWVVSSPRAANRGRNRNRRHGIDLLILAVSIWED
jgi:hypothetical protein